MASWTSWPTTRAPRFSTSNSNGTNRAIVHTASTQELGVTASAIGVVSADPMPLAVSMLGG
jgi:hypothetical protein